MKKYLYVLGIIGSIAFTALPAMSFAATTSNQTFCGNGPSYGYFAFTSASQYPKHTPVNFCLRDDTRSPLFLSPSWEITDSKGKVVYTSGTIAPPTQPQPSYAYFDSWNETNTKGKQVKAGIYKVIFFQYPGNPSATFSVEKNHHTGSIN